MLTPNLLIVSQTSVRIDELVLVTRVRVGDGSMSITVSVSSTLEMSVRIDELVLVTGVRVDGSMSLTVSISSTLE